LTVFGQGNKQERIKLYLAGKDGVSATTTAFAFAADQVMGTLADPLLLESASIDVAVYPNAFTDKLNIELSAYTGQEAAISLTDGFQHCRPALAHRGGNRGFLFCQCQHFIKQHYRWLGRIGGR